MQQRPNRTGYFGRGPWLGERLSTGASVLEQHGEGVSVMHQIKRALDPDDLMNPGKVLAMN